MPDIILKEFYLEQAKIKANYRYKYEVIDLKHELPDTIVLTSDELNNKILIQYQQKKLLRVMEKEKYKKIKKFVPDFKYSGILMNDQDLFFTSLLAQPLTISVYRK